MPICFMETRTFVGQMDIYHEGIVLHLTTLMLSWAEMHTSYYKTS